MNHIDRKVRIINMKKNRSITNQEWSDYLYNAYPEWWKQEFEDIWYFNIIYYPYNTCNTCNPIIYNYSANRFDTMTNILNKFNQDLIKQHLIIKLYFGEDIYQIIKLYLPNLNNLSSNYFYIHKYLPSLDNKISFTRYKIPNDRTLVRLMGDLKYQNHDMINLRVRTQKFNDYSNNFKKIMSIDNTIPLIV